MAKNKQCVQVPRGQWILRLKRGLNIAVPSQLGLLHVLDAWMTPHTNYAGVPSYNGHPLDGILCTRETPEGLRGLENITGASIDKVMSCRWVKYPFWLNYPFKNVDSPRLSPPPPPLLSPRHFQHDGLTSVIAQICLRARQQKVQPVHSARLDEQELTKMDKTGGRTERGREAGAKKEVQGKNTKSKPVR